ncbi:unnamed protein product [Eruca vesicaria subsp. sativa]|uniref:Uncharacterized protein n=1 Tax=Eruca vesicaria subsp. sativa TaxID=29727 RepID=A0ABC8LPF5_ERUVS|nr:unnamed protein product [Eruca vesicaria subsp. sativa]
MREALGLTPKSSTRPQGNRLDKQEFNDLLKRESTAEDLGAGKADAVWVHGLGYANTLAPSQTDDAGPVRMPPTIKTVENVPKETERKELSIYNYNLLLSTST